MSYDAGMIRVVFMISAWLVPEVQALGLQSPTVYPVLTSRAQSVLAPQGRGAMSCSPSSPPPKPDVLGGWEYWNQQ